jgi:DNA-directed RNA polymerase subunit delta
MQHIKERLSYLQGLAEGLNVGENSPEGRVLVGIIDLMREVTQSLEHLQMKQDQVEEYVEAIDDDLTDLENEFYDDYDEDLEGLELDSDDDIEDNGIEYIEMTCPNCGETVFVDHDVFENDEIVEVLCPECNETVLVNDETGDDAEDLV